MPAKTVRALIYKIVWDDGDAKKKADAWDRKLRETEKYTHLLQKAFLEIGKALGSFSIDAVKNFAQFEDTLSHARRTMSLSRDETLLLGDALMDLSTSFEEGGLAAGVSANELAKISGILGQLGFNVRDNQAQFESLVTTVAKVGTAFGMTSAKAAEGLGILRNLYDLPVEKIENAASSIAHLGNTTVATAGQIMTFMRRVGGIAGLLGVTAQEAAALGATLRESGVTANLAGTSMSQIFARMASDVDRFGEVLKKGGVSGAMLRMKIESGKATEALQMVLKGLQSIQAREGKIAATQALKDLGLSGVRVQQTLLALSNNLSGLNKNLAASNKAFRENTAVNDAYQSAIDNTSKKWTQFKNLIDIIKKLIGKDLAIAFSDFLEKHLIPFTERFKNWLKVSEGAKAIFGRDGLIASGLDNIGGLLSDNETAFFSWLDVLDKLIPLAIKDLQEEFEQTFSAVKTDLKDAHTAFEDFKQWIREVDAAIDNMRETWDQWAKDMKQLIRDLNDFGNVVKDTWEGISWDLWGGMGHPLEKSIGQAEKKMKQLERAIQDSEKAGQSFGDTMLYKSVIPDLKTGIIGVTEKTYDFRDTMMGLIEIQKDQGKVLTETGPKMEKLYGHLDKIYQTGENTFTNLSREVADFHEVFKNTGWKAKTDVQYHLTQTGSAVASLGMLYNQTGQEAEKAGQKMQQAVESAYKIKEFTGFQKDITRPTGELAGTFIQQALEGQQRSQAMTAEQVAGLRRTPGMFDAKGLIEALKAERAKAGAERDQTLNVTLMMGDQEIGHMYAALKDRSDQENRRSSSRGGSSIF